MPLSSLPPETLTVTLEFLADEDLATLLLAQRVCKRFQAIIEQILLMQNKQHDAKPGGASRTMSIHPLIHRHFHSILKAEIPKHKKGLAIGPSEPSGRFRRLPWAIGDGDGVKRKHMRGNPHLRPEASWRRLSVGCPAIRSLDVVKVLTVYGGTSMSFEQLDLAPAGGFLTMGLFYDLMASGAGHKGHTTTEWQLLPGRRFKGYDDWLALRRRGTYPSRADVMRLFEEDLTSAVLFVAAHRGCTDGWRRGNGVEVEEDEKIWQPEAIGGVPVVLHRWQGCVNKPRKLWTAWVHEREG
ncbi:hypothetical protein F4804DRAFT_296442 [Jackrogersella minutella]|nr:hypothetical protein F4804DRAFT_296442 [Jackrogersella minutella]